MSRRSSAPPEHGRNRSDQQGFVYPVQSLYGSTDISSPPKSPLPRKVSEDQVRIYDAPSAAAVGGGIPAAASRGSPAAGSSYNRPGRSHRRDQSGSLTGEETRPLIGAAPPLSRSNSGGRGGDEWSQSNPPPGILREPRRSRGFSSDGPLIGGLPPISPAAKAAGGAQVYDAAGGGGGSGGRDEMISAHERLQHRPIRSSGIGATKKQTKHRRAQSATDGPVTSLLKEDQGGSSGGYGATMPSQKPPIRRHSFQKLEKLPTFGGEIGSLSAPRRPSYRRSQTDMPPSSPKSGRPNRSARRSPSPSPDTRFTSSGGMRSRTSSAEGPAVTFESDSRPGSRPRARLGSAEGPGVTFDGDSPPASPLPPRPRVRTSSTENAFPQRDPFGSGSYMSPLDGKPSKPGHRRADSTSSAASLASALSFFSDLSVTSYVSDISKSKLFRGITETGDVQLHLPVDNVRLTMDPDLEAGVIYKQQDDDEIERFEDYHLLCTDPTAQDLRGFDLDDDLACNCDCKNCNQCISKRDALPDVRYVLNVDPDLYKRVLSEIADSRSYPCGLYYCGHHEDVDTPSIWIAIVIVVIFFLVMAAVALWWP